MIWQKKHSVFDCEQFSCYPTENTWHQDTLKKCRTLYCKLKLFVLYLFPFDDNSNNGCTRPFSFCTREVNLTPRCYIGSWSSELTASSCYRSLSQQVILGQYWWLDLLVYHPWRDNWGTLCRHYTRTREVIFGQYWWLNKMDLIDQSLPRHFTHRVPKRSFWARPSVDQHW